MRKSRYIIILTNIVTLVALMMGCTKPDRSEEAIKLQEEITELGVEHPERAVERVDSGEQAGVFTAARANYVKAVIYENADQQRLAAYYAEKAIAAQEGETVSDFVNRYRLEHVARLLKTTNDPIAIIGELSGIPSRVTLARLFRNAYGMTPTEYRKI